MTFARAAIICLALAAATPALAAGDPAAGKVVFNKCMLCHTIAPGKWKIGPSLWGVVGRKSGTLPGFNYSNAMKNFNQVWTPEELNTYLEHPQKVVVGTKMAFAGLSSQTDRDNVIAYLQTLH